MVNGTYSNSFIARYGMGQQGQYTPLYKKMANDAKQDRTLRHFTNNCGKSNRRLDAMCASSCKKWTCPHKHCGMRHRVGYVLSKKLYIMRKNILAT